MKEIFIETHFNTTTSFHKFPQVCFYTKKTTKNAFTQKKTKKNEKKNEYVLNGQHYYSHKFKRIVLQ